MKSKLLIIVIFILQILILVGCDIKGSYLVTFDLDGKGTILAVTVTEGELLERPMDPTHEAFNFINWFLSESYSGQPFDFNTPIVSDITLYAKWEEKVAELPTHDSFGNRYVDPVKTDDFGQYYDGLQSYLNPSEYGALLDLPTRKHDTPLNEVLGFVHAGGQYNFTTLPYLLEGAGIIEKDLGSKTIKTWLVQEMNDQYRFNPTWGTYSTLVDLAKDPIVRELLRMDFKTHIFVTYEFNRVSWQDGTVTEQELNYISEEFYNLTQELIKYNNTYQKTIILQNWEGDNELTPALQAVDLDINVSNKVEKKQAIIDAYIAYNNARQKGITDARTDFSEGYDTKVYGALELNYLSYNGGNQPKLIDVVVPHSDADLFSFSDWSTSNNNLKNDLEMFLNTTPKNNPDFGDYNIYLGEYGRAENLTTSTTEEDAYQYTKDTLEIALEAGVRYVVYWALYCNERVDGTTTRPINDDMRGFWLIRPDGSYSKLFWYFKGLVDEKNFLAELPKLVLRMPPKEADPIPWVDADVIFLDDFDHKNLDDQYDITRNKDAHFISSGLQYDFIKPQDQPFFTSYIEKYNLPLQSAYTVVQKKPNNVNVEYLDYEVVRADGQEDAKFIIQGFLYDPTPKSIIKVMVSEDGENYVDIESVFFMDKKGTYGYLYITTLIPQQYQYVRVLFTNIKAGNTWDPLISRVAFLK